MELGVSVRVRVWVGRSPGSYDAHSFYSPILHNQHVSPAVVLLQACWPVTEPVRRFWRDSCLHDVTRRRVCFLWAKISGVGTNRAGNSGRGLPGAPAAACGHRKSAVAEAIVRLESLAVGRVREGEQRPLPAAVAACRFARQVGKLAGYANAVQLGRLPRPFRGSRRYRNNSRQIREIRFCSAGVRSGCCGAHEKIELVIV